MDDRQLFEQYKEHVYRYCLYMTASRADAEDLCQEVFVKALLAKRSEITNEKAWLMRIAANECYSMLRRRSKGRDKESRAFWLNWPLRSSTSVEKKYEQQETAGEFAVLLEHLPDKLRQVLLLHYIGELSHTEIADVLKIPTGTVKSRLSRAIAKSKKLINLKLEKGSDIHAT
ncbi:RNA polymerase sigma factor [Paenibacillus sp. Z6-24]